jgi:pyruvate dehydrogenase E2 component (dihydrolipoamide acetyltransferase)
MQNTRYEIQDTNSFPLTRIQKLIGERMLKSKQTKPCFYMGVNADTTELMDSRHELKKQLGVKITSNAFYIKALALAVKEFPLMAGSLDGDHIKTAEAINVGFAVHSPQGLVVPVIKDADRKTLVEIAEEDKLLTEKARSNKLTLTDIEGETIALSNLGVYGVDYFFGIVPLQASTILAVGNVIQTIIPGYEGGIPLWNKAQNGSSEMTVRKITTLTLAVDRRVADEIYAAQFLKFIAEQLQKPRELV